MNKLCCSFILVLFIFLHSTNGQINNVRLVNHKDYVLNVIQNTVETLERRGWCNLNLPDIEIPINETAVDWDAIGTVKYSKGFVVSVQHVDILQSSVQQVWNWTVLGLVDVRATMRMHNVVVGYDVDVNLSESNHHYSLTYLHPLVNFFFSIVKDLHEDSISTTITGSTSNSNNVPSFLPKDNISDMLTTLYVRTSSNEGINAWGPDIIQPIVENIVNNDVPFPTVCYDCPVS